MAVSVGDLVDNTDYTGLVDRVNAVLGNGSGQIGYGQVVNSAQSYKSITSTNTISPAEWNSLRTDINKCTVHQTGANSGISTIASTHIIGANATGTTVTRVSGDTFSIVSPDNDEGFNDFDTSVGLLESRSGQIAAGQFDLTTGRVFGNSGRTTQWGVNTINPMIFTELVVEFEGGYSTTDSSGNSYQATGPDHRRHFFNAGGEIRLSATLSGSTEKDTDWGTMLGNMGQVVFGKNGTYLSTGGSGRARDGNTDVDGAGGIESALGNYQLSTGYQIIFQKNGSQAEYAENYVVIYAKRNSANTRITFLFEFHDIDSGDQTGIGPKVDEPVFQNGGSMQAGIDLKRPNDAAAVNIPEPLFEVVTELRLT
jgi:hypothetical protein